MVVSLLMQQDLLRPGFSFDYDDIGAILLGLAALTALFRTSRTSTRSRQINRTEKVDADLIKQFRELTDRITALELDLKETRGGLSEAMQEIKELRKLEEYLEAQIHEKDKQIKSLIAKLTAARKRISHLEDIIHAAGLNSKE